MALTAATISQQAGRRRLSSRRPAGIEARLHPQGASRGKARLDDGRLHHHAPQLSPDVRRMPRDDLRHYGPKESATWLTWIRSDQADQSSIRKQLLMTPARSRHFPSQRRRQIFVYRSPLFPAPFLASRMDLSSALADFRDSVGGIFNAIIIPRSYSSRRRREVRRSAPDALLRKIAGLGLGGVILPFAGIN